MCAQRGEFIITSDEPFIFEIEDEQNIKSTPSIWQFDGDDGA